MKYYVTYIFICLFFLNSQAGIHKEHGIYPANWNFVGSDTAELVAKDLYNYSNNDIEVIQNVLRRTVIIPTISSTGTAFFDTCNTITTALHNTHSEETGRPIENPSQIVMIKEHFDAKKLIRIFTNDKQLSKKIMLNEFDSNDYINLKMSKSYPFESSVCKKSFQIPLELKQKLKSGLEVPTKCFMVSYNGDKNVNNGLGVYLRKPGTETLKYYPNYADTRQISFCSVERVNYEGIIHHCDTLPGASGAALICQFSDREWYHAGVHANGAKNADSSKFNSQQNSENVAVIPE
jgi:hypothetical protein